MNERQRLVAEDAADAEGSLGLRLLADIRDVLNEWTVSFIASTDLVRALRKIDDAPWQDTDLTMNALARRLKPYGVRAGSTTTGGAPAAASPKSCASCRTGRRAS